MQKDKYSDKLQTDKVRQRNRETDRYRDRQTDLARPVKLRNL